MPNRDKYKKRKEALKTNSKMAYSKKIEPLNYNKSKAEADQKKKAKSLMIKAENRFQDQPTEDLEEVKKYGIGNRASWENQSKYKRLADQELKRRKKAKKGYGRIAGKDTPGGQGR